MDAFDNDRVFACSPFRCNLPSANAKRKIGVYTAGVLFALGWWIFVDGLVFSLRLPDAKTTAGFEDWAPGIVTGLGFLVVSIIDKDALRGATYDESVLWRARLFLFVGFALLAGGFAGSVSLYVVKYAMHDLEPIDAYLGITAMVQCGLLMLSTAALWISQPGSSDYFRI
ncbi:hypothetical protein VTP01DRAFT_3271 [Rhizomucor pusillus]|uniref:uncharacterized protein n=1 Tax=Rhizomucor pusillus TaxID=4840 RepID=UPI003742F97A